MIVAVALTVLGLLMGIAVVQTYGLRLSGVLVVPLLAVYSLYDFLAFPAFLVGVAAAYVGLVTLERRTFCFGRQLLLAGMGISVLVPIVLFGSLYLLAVPGIEPTAATLVGSVLPGVAAYNYLQLDDVERRWDDVVASVAALLGLLVLGYALVNVTFAPHIGRLTPPLLFAETSDIALERGADLRGGGPVFGGSVPVVIAALVAGMIASEGAYQRWGIRLNGIVALPLLALFALQSAAIVALYVAGLAAVYAAVRFVHRTTLLYGRVLLALAIAIALLGSIPVGVVFPTPSGMHLFLTGVLIGVGAYNLHRVPPAHRSSSLALSGGAFVLFLAGLRTVVEPSPAGMLVEPGPLAIGLGAVAVAAAVLAGVRLERLRPRTTGERRTAVTTASTWESS